MSIFDIVVGGLLIWGIIKGFKNGFIVELSSLVALVAGILGAMYLSSWADQLVRQYCDFEYTGIIVFLIIFIGIIIAMHYIAVGLTKVVEMTALNLVNRILGALFSVVIFAFIISVFVSIFDFYNKDGHFLSQKELDNSKLYKPISAFSSSIFPYLKHLETEPESEKKEDSTFI